MKIVIFGTGLFYERRKHMIPSMVQIVSFLDNNKSLINEKLDGVPIHQPKDVINMEYDYIVIASSVSKEMKSQLIELGVLNTKILYWEEFISKESHGVLLKYGNEYDRNKDNKSFLIIVPIINYAGGFMTALYAGQIMKKRGYNVVIASPVSNERVIFDVVKEQIDVWICPSLPYITDVELNWIRAFDYILCNSLQTMICATNIKIGKNLLFWLHEHKAQYNDIIAQYIEYCDVKEFEKINILAVSKIAKNNFLSYFDIDESHVGILPFGIPDKKKKCNNVEKKEIVSFAIIGSISPLKNQIQLVEVFNELPTRYRDKVKLTIIGRDLSKEYKRRLIEVVEQTVNVEIIGELPQEEVAKQLESIDVVICNSLEETMSMTIVEGLMMGKICITNTNTGIASYIDDGKNGFVFVCNNRYELLDKLVYIIENWGKIGIVGKGARKLYINEFSLSIFEKRLLEVFCYA